MVAVVTPIVECRCAATFPAGLRDFDRRHAELLGWHEIHSLVDSLTPEELLEPGYYSEGWTVRDLMAHLGAWLAEGGLLLEQIRAGTYREGELDVEATNQRFFELMEGLPFDIVYVQGWASRWRMLGVWRELPEITDAAAGWLAKVGAQHYEEHLPRLREWVAELMDRHRSESRR
ncbi:MAG: maleylpyruvate isomerase N-terminal domain-containing protein [Acidimicrobiia bacterium]